MKKTLLALMMAFSILIGISTAQAQIVIVEDLISNNSIDITATTTINGTGSGSISFADGSVIETTSVGAIGSIDADIQENTTTSGLLFTYAAHSDNSGSVSSTFNMDDNSDLTMTDSEANTVAFGAVVKYEMEDLDTDSDSSFLGDAINTGAVSATTYIDAPSPDLSVSTVTTSAIGASVSALVSTY